MSVQQSITCIFCKKTKPLTEFSPKQRGKTGSKSCLDCTYKQPTHITCKLCFKKKPVDKYSKTQRVLGNRVARCLICIDRRQKEDIWNSEPDSSDEEVDNKYDFD